MSNPGYHKARRTIIVLLTILGTSEKDQCSTVERKGESMVDCGGGTSDGIGVTSEKSQSKGNMSFK